MTTHRELLRTNDLTVGYATRRETRVLFKNLNLRLHAGKLICFMGPNGIGKSSLIRSLAGLQKPLGGSVTLSGEGDRPKQIAVVLTDRTASPNMTVHDVVSYGRYPYVGWNLSMSKDDNAHVEAAIERVGIGALRDEPVYTLSDGQLQMAMLARALAQDTPIILLDEPTAHLDLNNRVEIMKLLKELAGTTGRCIVVATHDLDLALQMANEIWLADSSTDIVAGMPEDLVLNGTFDRIFQFKGFDLKTGKVLHRVTQTTTVSIAGEGYEYLWTKNALERNGYNVVSEGAMVSIGIVHDGDNIKWKLTATDRQQQYDTLDDLVKAL